MEQDCNAIFNYPLFTCFFKGKLHVLNAEANFQEELLTILKFGSNSGGIGGRHYQTEHEEL